MTGALEAMRDALEEQRDVVARDGKAGRDTAAAEIGDEPAVAESVALTATADFLRWKTKPSFA